MYKKKSEAVWSRFSCLGRVAELIVAAIRVIATRRGATV